MPISKLDNFLARYFPQRFLLFVAGLAIFFIYYLPLIFKIFILCIGTINLIALLLIKYKLYKFNMSKEDCLELFTYIQKRQYLKNDPRDNFYCQEVWDDHGNFQHTEVFIKVNSLLRIPIDTAKLWLLNNAEDAMIRVKRIIYHQFGNK